MDFSLPAGALADIVGMVKGCTPSRTTVPILAHILVEAAAGRITVRGTDLIMEATATCDADVAKDGRIAIHGDVLFGVVKKLGKTAQVGVEILANGRAKVTSGRSKYEIRTLAADDYPDRKDDVGTCVFDVPASDLRIVVDLARGFVSTEASRHYLCGMHMGRKGSDIVMTATDGHRLIRRVLPAPNGSERMHETGYIIPTSALAQLASLLPDVTGDARVMLSPSRIKVDMGHVTFASQLVDGQYPDIDRVIPAIGKRALAIRPSDLSDAVERAASVYSGTDNKAPVARMQTMDGMLAITTGNDTGGDTGVEKIDADITDGHVKFSLNAKYLVDALKCWPNVPVDIHAASPGNPVVFTSAECPEMLHVIMPQMK